MQNIQTALARAVICGSTASIVSAAAMIVCSKLDNGSAAGALNAPSQWVWGEAEAYTRRATLRHTPVGYAVHHLTSLLWAFVHESAFAPRAAGASKSVARIVAEAAATSATAYWVDYHLTPRRLRPGFRKHLGPLSVFAVYASFAAGLAAASWSIGRRRAGRPAHTRAHAQGRSGRGSSCAA